MQTRIWFIAATCLLFILAGTEKMANAQDTIYYGYSKAFDSTASPITPTITAESTPSLFTNIMIYPDSNVEQTEMSIAANIANGYLLVGNNSHIPSTLDAFVGYKSSTDQGFSWSGSDTLSGIVPSHNPAIIFSDPTVAYDADGIGYFTFLWWNYYTSSLVLQKTTDNGVTWSWFDSWSGQASDHIFDKPHMTIDVNPSSPYKNFLYIAWSDFGDAYSSKPIRFTRTTDGGDTWSSPTTISGTSGYFAARGVNLTVGANGELYAAWTYYAACCEHDTAIGFNKSTDGGITWGTAGQIPISGFSGLPRYFIKGPDDDINKVRVNNLPSMDVDRTNGPNYGVLYLVWANASDNVNHLKPDVLLIKSTDGGGSWSDPVRVNDDIDDTQTDQWFPWVNVDLYGGVNIAFYDSRVDPTNNYKTQVYLGRSTDGGGKFINYQVSDNSFIPTYISQTDHYMGDYIGLTSTDRYVIPCWADNRSGHYQAYIARLPFTSITSQVSTGWNMTGIPVVVQNFAKQAVYPHASSYAYAYRYQGGYVRTDTLTNNRGWWIKFDSTENIVYTGARIDSMAMQVDTLWNIIGSISTPVDTQDVIPNPPVTVTSSYFKYAAGYQTVATLQPGGGYWVKVSHPGFLSLKADTILGTLKPTGPIADLDRFVISDAHGGRQELYVRRAAGINPDDESMEMPPDPPEGAFNVRFASGNIIQAVTRSQGRIAIPIAIRTATFPLTLTWELNESSGMSYWRNGQPLPTAGRVVIQSLEGSILVLEAEAGEGGLYKPSQKPLTYALHNNYPNPFNPSTKIKFDLPEPGKVSLVIYDILGRQVAEPVNGNYDAGYHAATWDASALSSGVYFARFNVSNAEGKAAYSKINKLVLIK